MGVAKAALEASRPLPGRATSARQAIRVNAISAGPDPDARRVAASAGFKTLYGQFKDIAPMRQNITIEDVGGTALYLASDLSRNVTGEIIYVDGGFNVLGVPTPQE